MTTQSVLASGLRPRRIGSPPPSASWEAPEVWLELPNILGEDKFVGLAAINEHATYFTFIVETNTGTNTVSEGFQVDWGNGDVFTYASGTRVSYLYDYTSVGNDTDLHKQALITVTPLGDDTLKEIDLNVDINTELGVSSYLGTSPWIEISVESPTLSVFNVGAGHPVTDPLVSSPPNINHRILKKVRVRCPNIIDYGTMFSHCYGLESVDLDTTNGENFFGFLQKCTSMSKFPKLHLTGATNLGHAFRDCSILGRLPKFILPNCTSLEYTFSSCTLIQNIEIEAPLVTSCEWMANSANVLTYIDLQVPSCTNFKLTFSSALSLSEVYDVDVSSGIEFLSMFSYCARLETFPDKDFLAGVDFTSMFFACTNFSELPMFTFPQGRTFDSMMDGTGLIRTPRWEFPVGDSFIGMFRDCLALQIADLWLAGATSMAQYDNIVQGCDALVVPAIYSPVGPLANYGGKSTTIFGGGACTEVSSLVSLSYNGSALTEVVGIDVSTITTPNPISFFCANSPRLSRVQIKGLTGNINAYNCNFGAGAIDEIFTNLATVITSPYIDVSNNPGAATCTPSIAIDKGWTVTT